MLEVAFTVLIILFFAAPIASIFESDDSNVFAYVLGALFILGGIIMVCLFPPLLIIKMRRNTPCFSRGECQYIVTLVVSKLESGGVG